MVLQRLVEKQGFENIQKIQKNRFQKISKKVFQILEGLISDKHDIYKSLSPKENVRNNKQQQANKCSRSLVFSPVVRTRPLELRNSKIPQIGPNYRGEILLFSLFGHKTLNFYFTWWWCNFFRFLVIAKPLPDISKSFQTSVFERFFRNFVENFRNFDENSDFFYRIGSQNVLRS